jgi:hypothetical protein
MKRCPGKNPKLYKSQKGYKNNLVALVKKSTRPGKRSAQQGIKKPHA